MEFLHAFLLAVIQGLTEFLPISSSAHLVLLPVIMQWQDQGVIIDIAAHFGSLLALLLYFQEGIRKLVTSWFHSMGPNESPKETLHEARLAWLLIYASIPIFIFAWLLHSYIFEYVRHAVVIGITSIVFGLLLWFVDHKGKKFRNAEELTIFETILIGIAQTFALIPGASRSGVTMTAGIWLGLTRAEAARFSFLLAVPTILGATLYGSYQAIQQQLPIQWSIALTVVVCSAIVAFLCIHWFIKFVNQVGMLPFVIYRILLGVVLLIAYW